jgi:hypothetical protein
LCAEEVLLRDAVYWIASRAVHAILLRPRGLGARLVCNGAVVRGLLAPRSAFLLALLLALLVLYTALLFALREGVVVLLAKLLAEPL